MASSLTFNRVLTLAALLCMAATCCKSEDPVGIVDNALECFHDHYVYSSCQEAYRLSAEGLIKVPPEATDEFCGGPCLAETKLVLKCIDDILYNFRFYNGASIQDVSHTLAGACGQSGRRGDFDITENIGAGGFGDNYYGDGNKVAAAASTPLMLMILSLLLLLWY